MIEKMKLRIKNTDPQILIYLAAVAFFGFSGSIVDSTLNNFLHENFDISGLFRSVIEIPREMPGFLAGFIMILLFFMRTRRMASFAMFLAAFGILLFGFASVQFELMLVWLFLFSTGIHLFLPLRNTIGMELARKNEDGKRLGQMNGVRNLALIFGSLCVFVGFRFLNVEFSQIYLLAAGGYIAAGILFWKMNPGEKLPKMNELPFHHSYRLFYWLNVLFGMRKQIFMTFAPWVLVTVYGQPTSYIASLIFAGGVIGIFFQPFLGRMIDRLGEKTILAAEAFVLFGVCLLYGFAKDFFQSDIALIVASVIYIIDYLLMSVTMARSIYFKKIARKSSDIRPALSLAVTIDHVFSISIALAGGIIWNFLGYQMVFVLGSVIAVITFLSVMMIRISVQPE